jgi:hypothetical protein
MLAKRHTRLTQPTSTLTLLYTLLILDQTNSLKNSPSYIQTLLKQCFISFYIVYYFPIPSLTSTEFQSKTWHTSRHSIWNGYIVSVVLVYLSTWKGSNYDPWQWNLTFLSCYKCFLASFKNAVSFGRGNISLKNLNRRDQHAGWPNVHACFGRDPDEVIKRHVVAVYFMQ